jgi:hypothetical protein
LRNNVFYLFTAGLLAVLALMVGVTVGVVFQTPGGQELVSGLWFDSPELRQQ